MAVVAERTYVDASATGALAKLEHLLAELAEKAGIATPAAHVLEAGSNEVGFARRWQGEISVCINRLLLEKAELENTLRAYTAHEVGHIVKGHVDKSGRSFRVARLFSRVAHALHLQRLNLCWRYEFEADACAAALVGTAAVLAMFREHQQILGNKGDYTHPPLSSRIAALEALC